MSQHAYLILWRADADDIPMRLVFGTWQDAVRACRSLGFDQMRAVAERILFLDTSTVLSVGYVRFSMKTGMPDGRYTEVIDGTDRAEYDRLFNPPSPVRLMTLNPSEQETPE